MSSEIVASTAGGRAVRLRFEASEHAARLAATRAALKEQGLSVLLVFAQESHYYLTGFDTGGYVFFQVGIVTADAAPTILLTRRPDLHQAETASLYDEVRVWLNAEDANPAQDLAAILSELGLAGSTVGMEYATYGLTGANAKLVETALAPLCRIVDASAIVRGQRLVKSPAELVHVRSAARLADDAIRAMVDAARPGALEGAVTAAGVAAMLTGGGDMPCGGPLVNSGERALFGRGIGGPRRLEARDQIVLELGASVCRYNACIEHTVVIGPVPDEQARMHDVAVSAMEEVVAAARPGTPLGTLNDIHARVLDAAGYATERFAACGYALGATFRPTWMDVPPMIYSGNPLVIAPGMVFFVHIMIPDRRSGLAVGVGQTFLITEGAAEVLSALPLELYRC